MTLSLPSTSLPTPPQCVVWSPSRCAGMELMFTVPEPAAATHVLGPQHDEWTPGSPTRNAGLALTLTLGDPWIAGPMHEWAQPGQPWLSAGTCA